MIDKRRIPIATPGSMWLPSSSGPRCRIAAHMSCRRRAASSLAIAVTPGASEASAFAKPAIPHIALSHPPDFMQCRRRRSLGAIDLIRRAAGDGTVMTERLLIEVCIDRLAVSQRGVECGAASPLDDAAAD